MLGLEAMIFQGLPISRIEVPPWVSEQMLQALAGSAVPCPVLLALALSTFVAISWCDLEVSQIQENSTEEDLENALELLAMIAA